MFFQRIISSFEKIKPKHKVLQAEQQLFMSSSEAVVTTIESSDRVYSLEYAALKNRTCQGVRSALLQTQDTLISLVTLHLSSPSVISTM